MYWDTKFAIRGRIEELAIRLNCELLLLSDDFDNLKAIQLSENLPDLKSRFELFSYVGAPGEPYMRVLSTEPSCLSDLATLFHWLKIRQEDILCESGPDEEALVDIARLRVMMQDVEENNKGQTTQSSPRNHVSTAAIR